MRQLLASLLLLACLAASASASHPKRMALGYVDNQFNTAALGSSPQAAEARGDGARVARLFLRWPLVVASRPQRPADPADPAYVWTSMDADVAALRAAGLQPLVTITGAPEFAEGPDRPESAPVGTWRPDPRALGAFARAAAARYRGQVRLWQIWNEPNLSQHLNPQYEGGRQRSTGIYRAMLNAAYRGIKRANPSAVVATAGTAPYGDPPGGMRTHPVAFWRNVLCLTKRLRKRACRAPARFDAWAHHPYGIGGPTDPAGNAEDAAIPDLGRISRLVRASVRRGTALPNKPKARWVTEFSWDSNPPDPDGVPGETHARWLEEALFEFWRAGVTLAVWFQVRDAAPEPSFGATYQSGTRLIDGTPKPALAAFRFPFVVRRNLAWGLAPRAGRVSLERRSGGRWVRVARPRATRGRAFTARVSLPKGAVVRAHQGVAKSLPWTVGPSA